MLGPAAALQHKGVGRAGVEPDVQNVGDHLIVFAIAISEEVSGVLYTPRVHALAFEVVDVFAVLRGDEFFEIIFPVCKRIVLEDAQRRLAVSDGVRRPQRMTSFSGEMRMFTGSPPHVPSMSVLGPPAFTFKSTGRWP